MFCKLLVMTRFRPISPTTYFEEDKFASTRPILAMTETKSNPRCDQPNLLLPIDRSSPDVVSYSSHVTLSSRGFNKI